MGNFLVKGFPTFNPQSYQGLWYEIARYPNFFEKICQNATALYNLKEGYLEIINRCFKK